VLAPNATQKAALLTDRDGILVELVYNVGTASFEAPLHAKDVQLRSGALDIIRVVRQAGWPLVVVSNQPAYAKGECTREQLDAVHMQVENELQKSGAAIDRYYYCHHHPTAVVPALAGPCACRKPAPGLLLQAGDELGLDLTASWMLGDRDSDMEAGRRAGCHTLLVPDPRSGRDGGEPDMRVADLFEAAEFLRTVLIPLASSPTDHAKRH